jgi:hypothetical protein
MMHLKYTAAVGYRIGKFKPGFPWISFPPAKSDLSKNLAGLIML